MAAKRKNGPKYSVVVGRPSLAAAKTALTDARRGRPATEQKLFKILKSFGEFKVIRLNVSPAKKRNAGPGSIRKTKKGYTSAGDRGGYFMDFPEGGSHAAAHKGTARRTKKKRAAKRAGSVTGRRNGRAGRSQKVRAGRKLKRAVFVRGRRNPDFDDSEQGAADMYKTFHGRDAERVTEFEIPISERLNVAECGKLRYLNVDSPAGPYKLFPKGVLVCTSPEGGQLYFVGGDQTLDLEGLGVAESLPKDLLEIGPCFEIEYHTSKDFHNFDPIDYFHHFGEESGVLPTLGYDNLNGLFYLQGGNYQVKREGIVD